MGGLHGWEVELGNAAGEPLPTGLLHHVTIISPELRRLFSPMAQRVIAIGAETGAKRMPRFLGYPIQKGQRWLVLVAFHNPGSASYTGLSLSLHLKYSSTKTLIKPADVYPFYLDISMPGGGNAFDLPPGRSVHSWDSPPAISGRVLGMSGHLHDHARLLRLEDLTADRVLWEVEPVLDEEGHILRVPTRQFLLGTGPRLDPDHPYRVPVIYANPTDRTIVGGGMGAVAGIFRPDPDQEWPAVSEDNPLYVVDLQRVVQGLIGHGRHRQAAGRRHQ